MNEKALKRLLYDNGYPFLVLYMQGLFLIIVRKGVCMRLSFGYLEKDFHIASKTKGKARTGLFLTQPWHHVSKHAVPFLASITRGGGGSGTHQWQMR